MMITNIQLCYLVVTAITVIAVVYLNFYKKTKE